MSTQYEVKGAIAIIRLDNPPVNGLSWQTRLAVVEGFDRAAGDTAVEAIVLTGGESVFSAGADIHEFASTDLLRAPTLHDLLEAVESSPKPVIAAINGIALGGGLELALASNYRVVSAESQVGLPEVRLGLLPGGGGTQRLPRAVGLERALSMIVSGESLRARDLGATRLFDMIVDGDALPAALALASDLHASPGPGPRLEDHKVSHPNPQAFLEFARTTIASQVGTQLAVAKCIEAVAASTKGSFANGICEERARFFALLGSSESKALRHAFLAERAATKLEHATSLVSAREISTVAVVGAGTMGTGIATALLSAGFRVTLLEMAQAPLDHGVNAIERNYQASITKARLSRSEMEEQLARLRPSLSWRDLSEVDLVIEAVFEDYAAKEAVFRKLDAIVRPGAILATNTSSLDVNRIASMTRRPQDVLGLHFFNPAHIMRLLEIVRGERTANNVLVSAMKLAQRLGKVPVVSGVCDGFIGNRMAEPYLRQALLLVEEGASPQQVDKAMEEFGFAMGPFRMCDLAGNDILRAARARRAAEDPGFTYPKIAELLCELGRFGQKTGAGWYDYRPNDRNAYPSAAVLQMVTAYANSAGLRARTIAPAEITKRLICALVNEGAKILQEGIAARPSDLDVAYINGFGFPRSRGGPMFYADTIGLYNVARYIRRFAQGYQGSEWVMAPLIDELARSGGTLGSVTR